MKAAESPTVPDPTKPALDPALRRKLNAKLPPGFAVAVNRPPKKNGKAPAPHLVFVKVPRNAGKPPRGGVHIPLPARQQMRLVPAGKHSRQQSKYGCFGNKGKLTILAKLMFMWLASCEAIRLAFERRQRRREAARARHFEDVVSLGIDRVLTGRSA